MRWTRVGIDTSAHLGYYFNIYRFNCCRNSWQEHTMPARAHAAPPIPEIVQFFKVLADETRLAIVRLLAMTDLRAGDVVERLHVPANAASYHFKHLRTAGLLRDRRSS